MGKAVMLYCLLLLSTFSFSQEQTKKEQRKQADSIAFNNLLQLVNSKNFEFSASQVLPQSGSSILLTVNEYKVVVKQDSIFCDLPFFGRAYQVNPFDEGGFHFKGLVQEFEVKTNARKKRITIEMSTTNKNDNLSFYLSATIGPSATLSVISTNRSAISYWGDIAKLNEKDNE